MLRHPARSLAVVLLAALCAAPLQAQAQGKGKTPPLGYAAIEKAERATGKKFTAAQKAQVVKLAHQREDAIAKDSAAEWKKFRTSVAKMMGLTLAQMEAKEKAVQGKKKG